MGTDGEEGACSFTLAETVTVSVVDAGTVTVTVSAQVSALALTASTEDGETSEKVEAVTVPVTDGVSTLVWAYEV